MSVEQQATSIISDAIHAGVMVGFQQFVTPLIILALFVTIVYFSIKISQRDQLAYKFWLVRIIVDQRRSRRLIQVTPTDPERSLLLDSSEDINRQGGVEQSTAHISSIIEVVEARVVEIEQHQHHQMQLEIETTTTANNGEELVIILSSGESLSPEQEDQNSNNNGVNSNCNFIIIEPPSSNLQHYGQNDHRQSDGEPGQRLDQPQTGHFGDQRDEEVVNGEIGEDATQLMAQPHHHHRHERRLVVTSTATGAPSTRDRNRTVQGETSDPVTAVLFDVPAELTSSEFHRLLNPLLTSTEDNRSLPTSPSLSTSIAASIAAIAINQLEEQQQQITVPTNMSVESHQSPVEADRSTSSGSGNGGGGGGISEAHTIGQSGEEDNAGVEQYNGSEEERQNQPGGAGGGNGDSSNGNGDNGNDPNSIIIRLKFLDDSQRIVRTSITQTVGDFKRKNFPLESSSGKIVRLIFQGQLLRDDSRSLYSYGIEEQCILHCHIGSKPIAQQQQTTRLISSSSASFGNTSIPQQQGVILLDAQHPPFPRTGMLPIDTSITAIWTAFIILWNWCHAANPSHSTAVASPSNTDDPHFNDRQAQQQRTSEATRMEIVLQLFDGIRERIRTGFRITMDILFMDLLQQQPPGTNAIDFMNNPFDNMFNVGHLFGLIFFVKFFVLWFIVLWFPQFSDGKSIVLLAVLTITAALFFCANRTQIMNQQQRGALGIVPPT